MRDHPTSSRRGLRAAALCALAVVAALALPALGKAAAVKRQALSHPGFKSTWAYLESGTRAYAAPSRHSRVLGYLGLTTQDGTSELLLEQRRVLTHGSWWVQVRLPLRPAGQIGWVPQWTLGAPQAVHTYVVVSTEKMTLTLYRDGKVIFSTRVGTGTASTPTPHGEFYIRDRLTGFAPGKHLRACRVRHLRAVQRRDGLARRRGHRHPRHERAVLDSRAPVPRLHSRPQLGDRPTGTAAADRHAALDRMKSSLSGQSSLALKLRNGGFTGLLGLACAASW